MWRKVVGWILFALGIINILSLAAESLVGWLGGLSSTWPITVVITVLMLWGGWKLAHSKPKK